MTQDECPVFTSLIRLSDRIASGGLPHPWGRQRALELSRLIEDVTQGRAGTEHYQAMTALAETMVAQGPDAATRETGQDILDVLNRKAEVFRSHIDTRNCATGDCARLSPAPCQMACPAGIDVPSYVTLIGQHRDEEAIELIRRDNPFPWVCGLVCTHPCEYMCVRGRVDEPISIKSLKGFAAERTMSEAGYVNPEKAPDNGHRILIVGAGPAGLAAAYYLALKGYRVTVIEGLPVAGGMMMVGIPRYRLPREVIDREVAMVEDLGVEIRFNTYLGQDVTIEGLKKEGFEAFLIAMGAHTCLALEIPGEKDFRPVIGAVELLRWVALGERHIPGRKVAVIGGGNVAIDAARTLLRLGCQEITVVYRRTRSEMPANEEEVEEAEEEGIQFSFLTMPMEIVGEKGRVTGLKCVRTELGPPDKSGRRRPAPVEGSEYVMDVDAVISAIGQAVHPGGLTGLADLKWTRRGTIHADSISMGTDTDGVFAAGDIVTGPATVIEAIGAGKRAAEGIDRYILGLPQPKMPPVPVRRARTEFMTVSAPTKMILKRPTMPLLGRDRRRVTFQQVEIGLGENLVREEALRCLRCDVCLRCGQCQAICRDKMGISALKLGYMDFDHPTETDFRLTAERCITCGACAANCPTGAISMIDADHQRTLSLCGTTLNRLRLSYCPQCGAVMGPARYLDFIRRRVKNVAGSVGPELCVDCARKAAAGRQVELPPSGGNTQTKGDAK